MHPKSTIPDPRLQKTRVGVGLVNANHKNSSHIYHGLWSSNCVHMESWNLGSQSEHRWDWAMMMVYVVWFLLIYYIWGGDFYCMSSLALFFKWRIKYIPTNTYHVHTCTYRKGPGCQAWRWNPGWLSSLAMESWLVVMLGDGMESWLVVKLGDEITAPWFSIKL